MAYGNLNVDTITGSGASSVIVNNGTNNVAGFTTGNNLQMLQNGGGIQFSNSSALTNSVLNDYETGTWTPTLTGTSSLTSVITTYTKVGNIVYCYFDITVSSIGTGNTYFINGFPFTCVNNDGGSIAYFNGSATNMYWVSIQMTNNVAQCRIVGSTSLSNGINNSPTFFQNGTRLIGSVVYKTTF